MNEETTTVPDEPSEDAVSSGRTRQMILGGVVGLAAVAAGTIVWLAFGRGNSSNKPHVVPIQRVGLSASGLRSLAAAVPQPLYWAGPRKGYLYELRRTSDGNVYIRYLPPGVAVGAPGNGYLVVATYPSSDALSSLQQSAEGQGISLPGGGLAVVNPKTRSSVYVAQPHTNYEAEVFDAPLSSALALVKAGQVRPVRSQ